MTPESLTFREAEPEDLEVIIALLTDDALGRGREEVSGGLTFYRAAFDHIQRDPNNLLLVACLGSRVVGTLQLTFTPSLSYQGGWRATIESVRTEAALRGQGIGAALVGHAIERARARKCVLMQLSSHASRVDARRFYERLGFEATHVGMKRLL